MSVTVESKIHFATGRTGQKRLGEGKQAEPKPPPPPRVPRVSRLMALAIHFDGLIREGGVRDYADLARLGGVTRARITQIMNMLNLSPEIQERLLFLEGPERGRDGVTEREMRAAAQVVPWEGQRQT